MRLIENAVNHERVKTALMDKLNFWGKYGFIIYSFLTITNIILSAYLLIKSFKSIRQLDKHDRSAAYVKLSVIGLWWYFLLFIPQKSSYNAVRWPFFITINNLNMVDFQRMIFELIIIAAIFISVVVWRRFNKDN